MFNPILMKSKFKLASSYPIENIVIDLKSDSKTRSYLRTLSVFHAFISLTKFKTCDEALQDAKVMQSELNEFKRNKV